METLDLLVRQITNEAERINTYELVHPYGDVLPPFSAGAHLDVHLPGGYVRQYSLCNAPSDDRRYLVGVLNEPSGRGGSRVFHESVRAGQTITVSPPRNNFPIYDKAEFHLLIAGGIGITPFMSMIEHFKENSLRYRLHYCTRSPARTAFLDRLGSEADQGFVIHHYDEGVPARGLDVHQLLEKHEAGVHLYYCGPTGFMDAVENAAAHWPEDARHFEYFSTPEPQDQRSTSEETPDEGFQVTIKSTGQSYFVPAGESIVTVLRQQGIDIETSCEQGICGTCKTAYSEGRPIHNDYVLTDEEKRSWVMVCCASCSTSNLVLDL